MGAKIGYYIFILPLSYLPLPVLYALTDFFFLILIAVFPYRKKVILGNIERSFPELSAKERKKLLRQFYRHFTDLLAEGVKNLTISEKELRRRFVVKNPEVMQEFFDEKRNVLLVSGHFNNWEWLITSQNFLFPHQAYGIGMPLSSQFWHKKVTSRRERFGMRVIHAKNYREKLTANPDELKAVLVLSDQSPGNSLKSYWMEFLNQPTAVLFGAEMMANELDYSVVFFATRKVKRGHYEMELEVLTTNPRSLNWGEITEAHTLALEKEIRNNPAQWLWSHRRWKREIPEDLEKLKTEQNEKFNARYR
ncbi:MAG: lipid A biosynthesis acyltransferase [bacterium]|nr:lipid A biosynthesis acyltransferase [bacterium]